MGKLSLFAITFDENRLVYFPGDTLRGKLTVKASEPMKMRAIKIKFVGRAYVHWTETHTTGSGENRRTETRHYSATEELFDHTVVVHGEGVNDQEKLTQGQHDFSFEYKMPNTLPSSYEDHIGYIRYWVKGTIDKPWRFDKHTKQAFTVLDTLDLNLIPNILDHADQSDEKVLCCWCCESGPIKAEFHTDRSGYVPGEYILINATVKNKSNSKVKYLSASLVQSVTYHATRKTRTESRVVSTIEGPKVKRKKTKYWENERLHIPPLPPSESTHCKIIDIAYTVIFRAHLRTCAIDLRLVAPVTIGTIPIRTLKLYGGEHEGFAPPGLIGSGLDQEQSAETQETYQAPPPSYEVSTLGGAIMKDDEDDGGYTMGDSAFTPQYTYYNWDQKAFTYN